MGVKAEQCQYNLHIALAEKFNEKRDAKILDSYFISRKLDGVRCIAIVTESGVDYWSRSGKRYTTLENLTDEIRSVFNPGEVLDGEVCSVDKDGNEDFQSIMTEIRRKNHTITHPKFLVFDLLNTANIEYGTGQLNFYSRYFQLAKRIKENILVHLRLVEQYKYTPSLLESMKQYAAEHGWEGLMLRRDAQYNGKRSRDLLKVKTFCESEYEVLGIVRGDMEYNSKDGKQYLKDVVSSLKIYHNGTFVYVGSGLSIDQRIAWANNPELIIGQVITVKYFEETHSKSGNNSLRFPVLRCVHGKSREV